MYTHTDKYSCKVCTVQYLNAFRLAHPSSTRRSFLVSSTNNCLQCGIRKSSPSAQGGLRYVRVMDAWMHMGVLTKSQVRFRNPRCQLETTYICNVPVVQFFLFFFGINFEVYWFPASLWEQTVSFQHRVQWIITDPTRCYLLMRYCESRKSIPPCFLMPCRQPVNMRSDSSPSHEACMKEQQGRFKTMQIAQSHVTQPKCGMHLASSPYPQIKGAIRDFLNEFAAALFRHTVREPCASGGFR